MADAHLLRPLIQFPRAERARIAHVITDLDGTLTTAGRLPACSYSALERLHQAGYRIVLVTGRPAGWCDHFARMWPLDGVVGENGAFYFCYDAGARRMIRRYWKEPRQRAEDRARLKALGARILAAVPGAAVAADQAYREADLAIDVREDVAPLADGEAARIVALFEQAGASAKLSSVHVNGWFGAYDKLAMTERLFAERFGTALADVRERAVYCGDSPNDAPMFAYFTHGIGMANVRAFAARMAALPRWITARPGGEGFAELAEALLAAQDAR